MADRTIFDGSRSGRFDVSLHPSSSRHGMGQFWIWSRMKSREMHAVSSLGKHGIRLLSQSRKISE